MAHEIAHFIDNRLGIKNGKRWETDNYESTAGIIAFTFRNSMNIIICLFDNLGAGNNGENFE
jgi:hypothetical protein